MTAIPIPTCKLTSKSSNFSHPGDLDEQGRAFILALLYRHSTAQHLFSDAILRATSLTQSQLRSPHESSLRPYRSAFLFPAVGQSTPPPPTGSDNSVIRL